MAAFKGETMRILTGLLALTLILTAQPVYAQSNAEFGKTQPSKKPAALDDGPVEVAPPAGIEIKTPPESPPTMPLITKANVEPYGPPAPPIPAAPAAEASDIIGSVVTVEGPVFIRSAPGAKDVPATDKTFLHLRDSVTTGAGARVLILLIDNSHITLGENAAFAVDTFIFDPDAATGNKLKLSFPKGSFKYAGSEVKKNVRADIWLLLPTGRSQVHGATVFGGPSSDGYSLFVLSGDVSVTTGRGRVTVRQGQGTSVRNAHDTPSRPDAWPPARITAVIAETKITDAKSASAKMALAREGQRTLIGRYKAWELLNAGDNSSGNHLGVSKSFVATPNNHGR
jgi:hypothetical protein